MTLDIYGQFETDKGKEKGGVVVDLGTGASITVARWFNPEHRAAVEALQAPFRSYMQSGRPIPTDKAEKIQIQAMSETILLGWSGITGRDGKEIPYSRENALKLLTDLKDFRDLVTVQSGTMDLFKKQEVAAAVGE